MKKIEKMILESSAWMFLVVILTPFIIITVWLMAYAYFFIFVIAVAIFTFLFSISAWWILPFALVYFILKS
jgi:hypothetical protein